MTFTKLFSSITESTIWVEPSNVRLVWITMLAMADSKGRVWASVPGLANRARVPLEDVEAALEKFMSPDKYSRTPDNEGRRIEPIDGGWRLLNHAKYRAIRDEEAAKESKRNYINSRREKERVEQSRTEANAVGLCRDIADADADADAETTLRSAQSKAQPSGLLDSAAQNPVVSESPPIPQPIPTPPPKPEAKPTHVPAPRADWRADLRAKAAEANAVELSAGAPPECRAAWQAWQDHRTAKACEASTKSQAVEWTRRAAEAAARQFTDACKAYGAAAVIARVNEAIAGNWQGMNLDSMKAAIHRPPQGQPSSLYGPGVRRIKPGQPSGLL